MITKEVLESLIATGELQQAIDRNGDYVYITLHIFNIGWFANIISCDYDEEIEEKVEENGNLFISKDDCLQLLKDYELDIEAEY